MSNIIQHWHRRRSHPEKTIVDGACAANAAACTIRHVSLVAIYSATCAGKLERFCDWVRTHGLFTRSAPTPNVAFALDHVSSSKYCLKCGHDEAQTHGHVTVSINRSVSIISIDTKKEYPYTHISIYTLCIDSFQGRSHDWKPFRCYLCIDFDDSWKHKFLTRTVRIIQTHRAFHHMLCPNSLWNPL